MVGRALVPRLLQRTTQDLGALRARDAVAAVQYEKRHARDPDGLRLGFIAAYRVGKAIAGQHRAYVVASSPTSVANATSVSVSPSAAPSPR